MQQQVDQLEDVRNLRLTNSNRLHLFTSLSRRLANLFRPAQLLNDLQPERRTMSPATQTPETSLLTTLARRQRRRTAAASQRLQNTFSSSATTLAPTNVRQTTRLPRVTRSDLLNIHQIHAASLNGLASQFTGAAETRQQQAAAQQQTDFDRTKSAAADQLKLFGAQLKPQTQAPPSSAGGASSTTPATGSGSLSSSATRFAASTPTVRLSSQQPPSNLYDSSPLATTNSISVHSSASRAGSGGSPFQSTAAAAAASSTSTVAATQTTTTTTTQAAPTTGASNANAPFGLSPPAHHHSAGNVLASYGSAANNVFRAQQHNQNALANAKYSLDGIIAVAIFGGFIFLGAIITILVIIVRR